MRKYLLIALLIFSCGIVGGLAGYVASRPSISEVQSRGGTIHVGQIFNHDTAAGFVANEHIDWTDATENFKTSGSVTASAMSSAGFVKNSAAGLLSGGNSVDISADTNLAASTGITLTDDTLTTNDSEIVHDNLSGYAALEHIDWTDATQDFKTTGSAEIGNDEWLIGTDNAGTGTVNIIKVNTSDVGEFGTTVQVDDYVQGNLNRFAVLTSLGDDSSFTDLAAINKPGFGFISANDGAEYCFFTFSADGGTITLINNSANCTNSDSDTDLNILDSGANGVHVKNRLGSRYAVQAWFLY